MPKVLGLVLSADIAQYNAMVLEIRRAWGSYKHPDFNVLYYYGYGLGFKPAEGTVQRHGDRLICGCTERVDNIMLKTIMTFDYIRRNFDFDYIIRTCCGAYVAPWRLLQYLEDKPREKFYAGKWCKLSENDAAWAHGIGYVLSRDLVELIADNADEVTALGPGRIDDVLVGRFLAAKGIFLTDLPTRPPDYPEPIPANCFLQHFSKDFNEMPALHARTWKGDVEARKREDDNMNCCICDAQEQDQLLSLDCGALEPSSIYKTVKIRSCKNCGHVFNQLTEDEKKKMVDYYREESSVGNLTSPNPDGDIPGSSNKSSLKRYSVLLDAIKPFLKPDDAVLDIGCASGGFLSLLKSQGFNNLFGMDMCDSYMAKAEKMGITVKQGFAENIPFDRKFDFLVADQVVEHLFDPNKIFEEAKRVLNKGGYFCIGLPDADYYAQHCFFEFHWFLLREHVQHFNEPHLRSLAGRHGFTCENVVRSAGAMLNEKIRIPVLTMVFKYTGNCSDVETDFSLRRSIEGYLEKSRAMTKANTDFINELRQAKTPIYVWGMSREFLYLYENTCLRQCNIVGLLDEIPVKQTQRAGGMKIEPVGALPESANVWIASFAHKEVMSDKLRKLGFKGKIL